MYTELHSTDGDHAKMNYPDDFASGMYIAEATKEVRIGFIRKVYSILSLQVLVTTLFCAGFMYIDGAQQFVLENSWSVTVAMVCSLVSLFVMVANQHVYPRNMILLAVFTLCESWMIGAIVSMYDTAVVIQACFLTMTVFLGLTLYTFISGKDFSVMGHALFSCLWILIIGGLLNMFWPMGSTTSVIFSLFGCVVFSLFILYDTSLIIHRLSTDDHILAAINLYLDILNLFLYILRLLNRNR